ncbi:MAG TPA: hypothetical protein VJP45_00185 [Candidatus Limnocylindria bacterium]|nr:hypothetical protein [Candidatus Limnocylindria bacterium]
MIRIHYRPLANRRAYESVCLPVPARRLGGCCHKCGKETDHRVSRGRFECVACQQARIVPRPDPLGDAVARGPRPRAATTREIPIAVDATLPAVSAALERLEAELMTMGLAHQAARCRAIGLAVGTVTAELRESADDRDANAHYVIRGVLS